MKSPEFKNDYSPNSEKRREVIISFEIDRKTNEALEQWMSSPDFQPLDQGADGIVFELNNDNITDELRELLAQTDDRIVDKENDHFVSKIIKIYSPTKARDEARLQVQASKLLAEMDQDVQDDILVPGHTVSLEVKITKPEVKGVLVDNLVLPSGDDRIGMIMMDKVEGQTFLIWACHQLIRQKSDDFRRLWPKDDLDKFISDRKTEASLRPVMMSLIGKDIMQHSEDLSFARYVADQLGGKGLIDAKKSQSLNSVLTHLNKNGFFHRDLHMKNIMIDNDGNFNLIDFGRSIQVDPRDIDITDQRLLQEEIYGKPTGASAWKDTMMTGIINELATSKSKLEIHGSNRILKTMSVSGPLKGEALKIKENWPQLLAVVEKSDDYNEIFQRISGFLAAIGRHVGQDIEVAEVIVALAESGQVDKMKNFITYFVNEKSSSYQATANRLIKLKF